MRSVSRSGQPNESASWTDRVEWTAADVFSPDTWRDHLNGCDAVIHSMGTLHEAPKQGAPFERVNGDSAIITALESERANVESYVFISASAAPPTVRDAYITAKRRAERAIADLDLRTRILRAGPLYGKGQPHFPWFVNQGFRLLDNLNSISEQMGDARPLPVEPVARAALAAADMEQETPQLLDIEAIAEYRR
ncbi:NAD-dependent epimerase/dehydratase [Candidatus Halobonum tyrrellensis G22]|uniref:NAD-dependent epimerase/dehydratase n=1 Tax=Candidatus Halobonum tyrrellensis G22 TaxID=1324957 RepID=V4H9W5_9EURY|nr:NAD-dependent epimerase/dehydratase [Candidatus Halobonum tyrrellensis G22]